MGRRELCALVWLSGGAAQNIYAHGSELRAAIEQPGAAANGATAKDGSKNENATGAGAQNAKPAENTNPNASKDSPAPRNTPPPQQQHAGSSKGGGDDHVKPDSGGSMPSSVHRPLSLAKAPARYELPARVDLAPAASPPDAALTRGHESVRDASVVLGLVLARAVFITIVLELRRSAERAIPPRVQDSPLVGTALKSLLAPRLPAQRDPARQSRAFALPPRRWRA